MLSKSNLTFILLLFASLTIAVMASGLTPILEYWQFGTPQAANIRTDQPLRSEVPFGSGHEARAMEQKIEALAPDDVAHLEKQRVWVRDHYDAAARHQYETVEGKLRLLDTIIRSKWIEPSETWKLQSLGVTFGDALAQELGLAWVAVEDEHGRDPALRDPGTSIVAFPMTTISKR